VQTHPVRFLYFPPFASTSHICASALYWPRATHVCPFSLLSYRSRTCYTRIHCFCGDADGLTCFYEFQMSLENPLPTSASFLSYPAGTTIHQIDPFWWQGACNIICWWRDRLSGLVVRVPGYWTEMYCASCEVRTEFIYIYIYIYAM
jgi:hypothetical protein